MTKNIKLPDDLAEKLGRITNKDETWADGVARVFAHTNMEAAIEDRDNRETVYSETQEEDVDHPLDKLEDGTTVRHKYYRGDYAGDVVEGTLQGREIIAEGDDETKSPSGAAEFADKQHRGDDARSGGWNGWEWWEFQDDDGEWVELLSLC